MNKKHILVLEDLGIPKADFEKIAAAANSGFRVIWQEDSIQTTDEVDIVITVKTKVDKQLLAKYPNVKVIAVAFTGYDGVDLETCHQNDIAVYNVPAYSTNTVAELTVGLAISLLRKIPTANHLIHSGTWNMKPGQDLSGKTVGILGTGTIGLMTARFFKAFGCEIVGWSRTEKDAFKTLGKYISDLQTFFSIPDIVSVHLPLNQETNGIVGAKELGSMRATAYLINTARGPIVNEAALVSALNGNRIAGAALDVFAQEPIGPNNRLLQLPNVILTPHIAYKTVEALERRAKITIENITNFLRGNKTNRVN